MLRITMFLSLLLISAAGNTAILDLGNITRDTSTGLDWLDLTETRGRTYLDISAKFGAGEEFEGWRYASIHEVEQIWQNLGVTAGSIQSISVSDTDQYLAFINAVTLLGNTSNAQSSLIDYGSQGRTGTPFGVSVNEYHIRGMFHEVGASETESISDNRGMAEWSDNPYFGSYLVKPSPVPLPSAVWLFSVALLFTKIAKISIKGPWQFN